MQQQRCRFFMFKSTVTAIQLYLLVCDACRNISRHLVMILTWSNNRFEHSHACPCLSLVRATKPRNKNYSSKEDHLHHLANYYEVKLLTDVQVSIRDYSTDHQLPRSTFQMPEFRYSEKLLESFWTS
jgi:hypothetical protein